MQLSLLQFWETSLDLSTLVFACRSHSLLLRIFVTSKSRGSRRGLHCPPLCPLWSQKSWIHPGLHFKSIWCFLSSEQSLQFRVEGKPGYTLPVFRGGSHPVWGLTAIITLQVRLPFSQVCFVLGVQFFFLPSFCELFSRALLISIDSSSSPRSSCDGTRMSCETHLLWIIQRGGNNFDFSFRVDPLWGQDGGGEQQLALRGHHRLLSDPHHPGLESPPCPGQLFSSFALKSFFGVSFEGSSRVDFPLEEWKTSKHLKNHETFERI